MLHQPPRWRGFAPPASTEATPTASPIGNAMNIDEGGPSHWLEQVAPCDSEMMHAVESQGETDPISLQRQSGQNAMIQNGNVLTMTEPTPVQRQGPRLKSVIYGPSIPSDPLVTVIPSILQKCR